MTKIDPRHWKAARNALVKYAARAPLVYVWREYQEVVEAWQRKRKVMFLELAKYDRSNIITHLKSLR